MERARYITYTSAGTQSDINARKLRLIVECFQKQKQWSVSALSDSRRLTGPTWPGALGLRPWARNRLIIPQTNSQDKKEG